MPINHGDFEKNERDASLVLLEFLRHNYLTAYSVDEVVKEMAARGKDLTKTNVERLLSALEYGGRAESKVVDGETYYRYHKVAGLRII